MAEIHTENLNRSLDEPALRFGRGDAGAQPIRMGPATATLVWLAACGALLALLSGLATVL